MTAQLARLAGLVVRSRRDQLGPVTVCLILPHGLAAMALEQLYSAVSARVQKVVDEARLGTAPGALALRVVGWLCTFPARLIGIRSHYGASRRLLRLLNCSNRLQCLTSHSVPEESFIL